MGALGGVATVVDPDMRGGVWLTGVVIVVAVIDRDESKWLKESSPGGVTTSLQVVLCNSNVSFGTNFLHRWQNLYLILCRSLM